ncbi:MAG: hypothetical protein HRT38_16485 [Alteromonadaceae bacterium]|nr:hypothetical protein [Alteromonadaceae bacterium]
MDVQGVKILHLNQQLKKIENVEKEIIKEVDVLKSDTVQISEEAFLLSPGGGHPDRPKPEKPMPFYVVKSIGIDTQFSHGGGHPERPKPSLYPAP